MKGLVGSRVEARSSNGRSWNGFIQQLPGSAKETCATGIAGLALSLRSSKSTFSKPFKEKCISEVVRIGIIIIFHLSKLWKPKFFIKYDVKFLVRLQGNYLKLITVRSERVNDINSAINTPVCQLKVGKDTGIPGKQCVSSVGLQNYKKPPGVWIRPLGVTTRIKALSEYIGKAEFISLSRGDDAVRA